VIYCFINKLKVILCFCTYHLVSARNVKTPSPEYASDFEVMDKSVPEAFGVQRNEEWNVKGKAIYERYLQLFDQGVFRCARNEGETARIYFSGGIIF
jgi:hypothetical protein